ncbi:hypothetical protein TP46_12325 [Xanthomonas citri pv. aurantifolii]|nr:hypothetical protein TP49_11830 [Xanthomonas citri pv. aurantifolii]TBX03213.1 hypothetical protein TP46_12325 [Xanthomonas citri pv. aurantifolii]
MAEAIQSLTQAQDRWLKDHQQWRAHVNREVVAMSMEIGVIKGVLVDLGASPQVLEEHFEQRLLALGGLADQLGLRPRGWLCGNPPEEQSA